MKNIKRILVGSSLVLITIVNIVAIVPVLKASIFPIIGLILTLIVLNLKKEEIKKLFNNKERVNK